jgi:hypothetical protein
MKGTYKEPEMEIVYFSAEMMTNDGTVPLDENGAVTAVDNGVTS